MRPIKCGVVRLVVDTIAVVSTFACLASKFVIAVFLGWDSLGWLSAASVRLIAYDDNALPGDIPMLSEESKQIAVKSKKLYDERLRRSLKRRKVHRHGLVLIADSSSCAIDRYEMSRIGGYQRLGHILEPRADRGCVCMALFGVHTVRRLIFRAKIAGRSRKAARAVYDQMGVA